MLEGNGVLESSRGEAAAYDGRRRVCCSVGETQTIMFMGCFSCASRLGTFGVDALAARLTWSFCRGVIAPLELVSMAAAFSTFARGIASERTRG